MTATKQLSIAISLVLLFASCVKKQQFDPEKEKKEILKLHNAQRAYHFNKDSIAFANQMSANFISVNKGIISHPKKEETIARYNGYFSAVEFIKWDDVSEPIIKFSDDGSIAYTIVDKIVTVTYKDQTGNTVEGETHFAWTAIYKKYGQEWKIDCVTSTEKRN
ncbi:nuclear transport factor 2 family protein [uncultured Kordia sp.]|uniref:nuclear transport factor 2 family protein n=1 Tax=uncultured Kordia sp. TaxID=507699 RepID=UPI00261680F1|nr:nuclear transport factor 2 family protein [uncultured Kordia sp.]